jgi:hypothetical protein
MGSTGSGRLPDYPGSSKSPSDSSGSDGTPFPSDRCARAISVALEDIEHCDYFGTHGVVPPVGEILKVAQRKRVVAETTAGVTVGNLPTSYNYLAACLKDGWTYVGSIRSGSNGPPLAAVTADFGAVSPP